MGRPLRRPAAAVRWTAGRQAAARQTDDNGGDDQLVSGKTRGKLKRELFEIYFHKLRMRKA
jgi:hypothetical protein